MKVYNEEGKVWGLLSQEERDEMKVAYATYEFAKVFKFSDSEWVRDRRPLWLSGRAYKIETPEVAYDIADLFTDIYKEIQNITDECKYTEKGGIVDNIPAGSLDDVHSYAEIIEEHVKDLANQLPENIFDKEVK